MDSFVMETYHYDAEGLRAEMEENGQLVKFLFNEEKEVIAEETNNEVIRYIRGLGFISSDSESARTYYHYVSDNQGSVRLILTDTTNDRKIRNYYYYDSFGESVISHEDIHNRFRFNGEQYDPVTSQYYLRARYYNPIIGRFTQEDTYYGDGLNLYEYCRNNPVLYRDPSGHDVCPAQYALYKQYREAGMTPQQAWDKICLDGNGNPKSGLQKAIDLANKYTLSKDTYYNHILDRHGPNSKFKNKSHFNANFDIRKGIDSTLKSANSVISPNTAGRDGYIFEQTFTYPIGIDSKGKPLYTLKVVIDKNGNVVTAFPKK